MWSPWSFMWLSGIKRNNEPVIDTVDHSFLTQEMEFCVLCPLVALRLTSYYCPLKTKKEQDVEKGESAPFYSTLYMHGSWCNTPMLQIDTLLKKNFHAKVKVQQEWLGFYFPAELKLDFITFIGSHREVLRITWVWGASVGPRCSLKTPQWVSVN